MPTEQKLKTVLDSYKFVFRNLKTECIEHENGTTLLVHTKDFYNKPIVRKYEFDENGKDTFNYVSKD